MSNNATQPSAEKNENVALVTQVKETISHKEDIEMMNTSVERTSFCRVGDSFSSTRWLYRLADIENGVLRIPYIDEDAPKAFDNRTRLYWRNGPSVEGSFGVWNWTAVPNMNNPDSDYIESDYLDGVQVIEIVEIPGASDLEQLIKKLQKGISAQPVTPKTFLCFRTSQGTLVGVLCLASELSSSEGLTSISKTTQSLPTYEINTRDTLSLEGRSFYRHLSFDASEKRILVKEPIDIVRNAIIRRTSWAAVKSLSVNKSAWRSIRELIEETPNDNIYCEIAATCHCSEEEAKEYVSKFLENVERYITHNDFDGKVLEAVLEGHPSLMQRCESIVSKQWHSAHKEEIRKATEELEAVKSSAKATQAELKSYAEKIAASEKALSSLKKTIVEQEQLADRVSEQVRSRIAEAQSDAAAFIAEMAFASPSVNHMQVDVAAESFPFRAGDELDPATIEASSDWKDTIETLRLELMEAGVAEKYSTSLAAILYSAFLNHTPLLLAGPNGINIADAFAAALFGRTAGRLDCSAPYLYRFANEMASKEDHVVAITNAFRSGWITHIPELLTADKAFFIVHPFVEDLLIEPKSLFSYAIPIITEFFVDSMPAGHFVGAKNAPDYKEYQSKKAVPQYENVLKSLGCGALTKARIQAILSSFHGLMGDENADLDCLYMILPYAFITCSERPEMIDHVISEMGISNAFADEIKCYLGVGDE